MPEEVKNTMRNHLSTNYNFDDISKDKLAYLNRLFSERYKQWKSDLHQYFEMFDDPQVVLKEGCPNEFMDRQDSWVWLCGHFQESGYVATIVEKGQSVLQESASQLPPDTPIKSVDPPKDAGFHILT
ncbi:hypothetical protein D8674_037796 [Pyrus ussuriensis x Pyrus communis]|uniref:Uncharacterized protein n=1 Tax=Pyrus ussuriensis x Pyrus communis TaxID=2448454 RepID=A0A5N5H0C2_9ROSA|nr:hypothetical protein D8674_037796 [Pyrus ussuriensis x Pyrus communis]